MSLTFPGAPLASEPPATTNYAIDGPRTASSSALPAPGARALAGEVVFDSTRDALLHESNMLPRLYVPLEDVRADLLERTDHATHCPFKGDATYWWVRVGDRVAENAVWTYEEPIAEAAWLHGLVGVYLERMDTWLDEDEEVTRPPRPLPPRRRAPQLAAHRGPRRRRGARRSERPVVVAETGLPAALLPPARGRARRAAPQRHDRRPAPTRARRRTGRSAASRTSGWSYADPLESMLKARGHVSFDASKVEVLELTGG